MRKVTVAGVGLIIAGAGCAYGEVRHVVRAQFASEVDCGEVRVEKKGFAYFPDASDKDRYMVAGCGVERTYTCPRDAGLVSYDDEAVCTWVEGDSDRPEVAQGAPEGVDDPFADGASAPEATPAAPEPAAPAPKTPKNKKQP